MIEIIIAAVSGFVLGRIVQFFRDSNRGIGPKRNGGAK